MPSWCATGPILPPNPEFPQATTDPLRRTAAKAANEAAMCFTSFSSLLTELQSPPYFESPHDTTRPSPRTAQNALVVAAICTSLKCSETTSPILTPASRRFSSSRRNSPDVLTKMPRPVCKEFCACRLSSPTVQSHLAVIQVPLPLMSTAFTQTNAISTFYHAGPFVPASAFNYMLICI